MTSGFTSGSTCALRLPDWLQVPQAPNPKLIWAAVQVFNLNYYIVETILNAIYTQHGNLI